MKQFSSTFNSIVLDIYVIAESAPAFSRDCLVSPVISSHPISNRLQQHLLCHNQHVIQSSSQDEVYYIIITTIVITSIQYFYYYILVWFSSWYHHRRRLRLGLICVNSRRLRRKTRWLRSFRRLATKTNCR
jgi:hypothetical protein